MQECMEKKEKGPLLQIVSWIEVEELIYFKAYNYIGLYVYDKNSGELNNIEEPMWPEGWDKYYYRGAVRWNEYIVFLPYVGHYFELYNMLTGEIKYIAKGNDILYHSGVLHENKIIMFSLGTTLSDSLVFDLLSERISQLNVDSSKYGKCKLKIKAEICKKENKIYLPICDEAGFLVVNLENLDIQKITIPMEEHEVSLIYNVEDNFYIAGSQNYLIKWDGKDNFSRILIPACETPHVMWDTFFSEAVVVGKYLYLAPLRYDRLIRLDLHNDSVEEVLGMVDRGFSFGIKKYDEEHIYLDFSYDLSSVVSSMKVGINNVVKEERMFAINDNMDLSMSGKEITRQSLRHFLNRIIEM